MATPGRIIGIVAAKGGVGKTTVTINTGAALASRMGASVVVVDCNVSTSHLGVSLGMHYVPNSLHDLLAGKADFDEVLYKHAPTGMMVLPASLKSGGVQAIDFDALRKAARKLAESYEFVLLDGAPGLAREAMATLATANELLYVTTPTMPSVLDVVRYRQAAKAEGKAQLGVVLNMFDMLPHQLAVPDVERLTQLPVVCRVPTDPAIYQSLAAELPAVVHSPNSPASRSFIALAKFLSGPNTRPVAPKGMGERISEGLRRMDEFIGFR